MNKKASVGTLLVVALVALGLMTYVGFDQGATGTFTAPKPPKFGPGKAITPPLIVDRGPETVIVDNDDDVVYYETDSYAIQNILISCDMINALDIGARVTPNTRLMCAKHGVPIST
jgi:hypothetical protein